MSTRPRPSWTYLPDDWSWRDASWGDRARVVAIVAGIIAVALAGSIGGPS